MISETAVKNFAKSSCGNKRRFFNKEEAKRAAGSLMRSHGGKVKVYRCGFCDMFHMTRGRADADHRTLFRELSRSARAQRDTP